MRFQSFVGAHEVNFRTVTPRVGDAGEKSFKVTGEHGRPRRAQVDPRWTIEMRLDICISVFHVRVLCIRPFIRTNGPGHSKGMRKLSLLPLPRVFEVLFTMQLFVHIFAVFAKCKKSVNFDFSKLAFKQYILKRFALFCN